MMRWKQITLLLALLLAGCQSAIQPVTQPATLSPSPTPTTCPAGDYNEQVTSSGEKRQYRLHVPASYRPEEPAALILGFHGAGSYAAEFESYSGFTPLADKAGFLVVYLQAQGEYRFWNTTPGSDNRDIQFARDVIEKVKSLCNIDPARIYAIGHSNGGGMANRLACDLSDEIAAIGSVSGAYRWSEACSPTRPVSILGIHGTDDTIIPYNGYQDSSLPPMTRGMVDPPIRQWASGWSARNGCDQASSSSAAAEQVTAEKWSHCRGGAEVIFYTIDGGGHAWPDALDASQVIWNFFGS